MASRRNFFSFAACVIALCIHIYLLSLLAELLQLGSQPLDVFKFRHSAQLVATSQTPKKHAANRACFQMIN